MTAVSLSKNSNRVSLSKRDGSKLKQVKVDLYWKGAHEAQKSGGFLGALRDAFSGGGTNETIDLDASVVAFDGYGSIVDTIWFSEPNGRGCNGAIRHLGDNRTGGVESVYVDLEALPPTITKMVFTINSFTNQNFNRIAEASCEIVENTTREVCIRQSLTDIQGQHTALILCKFEKDPSGNWNAVHIGYPCRGRTVRDITQEIYNNNF